MGNATFSVHVAWQPKAGTSSTAEKVGDSLSMVSVASDGEALCKFHPPIHAESGAEEPLSDPPESELPEEPEPVSNKVAPVLSKDPEPIPLIDPVIDPALAESGKANAIAPTVKETAKTPTVLRISISPSGSFLRM
ncbi:hypothetical protein [Rhodococcus sp. BH5]|uniref:hypothetical protein n=1 Tax=Rhodococcus sp. BH5 TaxID=2871702 RepID=UPI0022CD44F9|nr:hypothetical protein [Rhodococcus sp. BH5]MCZ9635266.1 hypothetical protein [Rhodococcus sp. BH5]